MSDSPDFTEIDAIGPIATAALAAAERGDPDAACAAVLEAADFPASLHHLPRLPEEVRRGLARHCVDLYRAAGPGERRDRVLLVHGALLARRLDLAEADGFEAAMLAAMHIGPTADDEKRALCATALASPDFTRMVDRLRPFEREMRRRIYENVLPGMRRTASIPQQRERVEWMRAVLKERPLHPLDLAELDPLLLAAVEQGDVAAACAMVLADRAPHQVQDRLVELPEDVRIALVDGLADLHEAEGDDRRRTDALRMHALLSMSLERPDDRLADARQAAVRAVDPDDLPGMLTVLPTAWVELASGRDIPVRLGAAIRHHAYDAHPFFRDEVRRITVLVADRHPPVNAGQRWTDRALAELADRPAAWAALVRHAATATTSRPGAAWRRTGSALLAEVDGAEFRDRVLGWLDLIGDPKTLAVHDNYNNVAARGLVWLLAMLPEHPRSARGLGSVLEKALRKAPGLGPGLPKIANACANALNGMEGEAALAELARLSTRVTYRSTLKLVEAGLSARAEALGLGREEVEELAVPAYGLDGDGRRTAHLGAARAELAVDGRRAELRWYGAGGRPVASVPAAVRRDHPAELKELKADAKAATATLSAVAKRLESRFLSDRGWSAAAWRERYLDHPLVGTLARRLIWTVDGTPCAYADGELRDLAGAPVPLRGTVLLWHPVGRPVEEALAWRERLEDARITQPFKQAHREVYLLTDAERRTATYSNRFAGHILRQYAFRALAAERGWRDAELRICHHDCSYPPAVRELPEWGVRAEYWVRGEGAIGSAPTTGSGAYELLAADQVRFYPIDAPQNHASTMGGGFSTPRGVEPVPLAEVPERVLSEVLRDVDLFVGVAGVASDPTWQDGGPGGHYREYWSSHGFGELSATARTRHDLLARLVPRLAIGDRCRVEGRFLHVKGELHTYRIHLGSGNVLMDPGDRYLCIVPGGAPAALDDVYLPFDGDRMLSVILSKALLLADDTSITAPDILSQIRPEG